MLFCSKRHPKCDYVIYSDKRYVTPFSLSLLLKINTNNIFTLGENCTLAANQSVDLNESDICNNIKEF